MTTDVQFQSFLDELEKIALETWSLSGESALGKTPASQLVAGGAGPAASAGSLQSTILAKDTAERLGAGAATLQEQQMEKALREGKFNPKTQVWKGGRAVPKVAPTVPASAEATKAFTGPARQGTVTNVAAPKLAPRPAPVPPPSSAATAPSTATTWRPRPGYQAAPQSATTAPKGSTRAAGRLSRTIGRVSSALGPKGRLIAGGLGAFGLGTGLGAWSTS